MMLLTKRQKFILRDLLKEEKSITAKVLAEKYNVSLRTIRYDLDDIEYWLKERGATLIKIPRIGIKIKNKELVIDIIKDLQINVNEVVFSEKDRINIILLRLVFAENAVSSEELAKELNVSRGTILNTIKEINEELKQYSISIEGKTKHGFYISGDENNIRYYIKEILTPIIINGYGEKIYSFKNLIFTNQDLQTVHEVICDIKNSLNIRLEEKSSQVLKFKFIMLIKRIQNGHLLKMEFYETNKYKNTKIYNEAEVIYKLLMSRYNIPYEECEVIYICRMLLKEKLDTDCFEESNFDKDKLLNVTAEIINFGSKHLSIKESEIETLTKDLFSHLKLTLNRYELNISSENPILEQIKAKYGDIFQIVKKACKPFSNEYKFELSEDEIGFITMYFLKSLEKSRVYNKKNIIVVCNTSRGTSKLLATRIKNNIHEINIKAVVSIIDIDKDEELLEDVDLIISTIKIDNVKKPVVIVSPIITMYELNKIRDFLYIEHEYDFEVENEDNYVQDTLANIIEKYMDKKNSVKFYKEITSLIDFHSNNDRSKNRLFSNETEEIGLILIEISDMFFRLYPKGVMNQEQFKKVFGIIIHIIMAIPRWQKGEYNIEKNVKGYEKKYPEAFKIIEETFDRISNKYKIKIKKTEIVAILRYLI